MKNTVPAPSRFTRWLAVAALAATGWCVWPPARADASLEPLTNILSLPGSAGLGVVTQFEASPYQGGGNR